MTVAATGCVVMAPSPAIEAANLVSIAAMHAAATVPGDAEHQMNHPHGRFQQICIEINREVAVADFLSALQNELHSAGIDSRIYERGMQPTTCKAVLNYTAFIEWDRPAFGEKYASYLTFATFTLYDNGLVLASANYAVSPLGLDKWSPTDRKISGAVKALLVEN